MPSTKTLITIVVISALVYFGLKKFGSKIPFVGSYLS